MSDGGADDRPRPQYGEYASPEEQRARIQHPGPAMEWPEASAEPSAPAADVRPAAPAPRAAGGVPSAPAEQPAPARPAAPDRIITAVLLGLGAVNVFFTVPGFLDLAGSFGLVMESMGIPGEFTNTDAARTWGAIAAVVLVAGYLITALAAWRRMRAGRISWWIPVVGVLITYAVVVACLTVPVAGDPAFQEYVSSRT